MAFILECSSKCLQFHPDPKGEAGKKQKTKKHILSKTYVPL